ncbi:MAG: hypothetical protein RR549_04145, partial [Oscillospiraceae bacterium]
IKSLDILTRKKQIFSTISLIKTIKISLTYGQKEIWQIFEEIKENNEFNVLSFLKDIKKDAAFKNSWINAIEKNKKLLKLEKNEKQILISIGDFLGIIERENQISILQEKINMFENILLENEEQWLKKAKLYKSLGLLSAFAVIIFFL